MKKTLYKNEEVLLRIFSPAKFLKTYFICAWKLSLNKGNYAIKSFVKNI